LGFTEKPSLEKVPSTKRGKIKFPVAPNFGHGCLKRPQNGGKTIRMGDESREGEKVEKISRKK